MKNLNVQINLLLFALVTVIAAVVYICVQQVYRTGADDPQIEIATSVANAVESHKNLDQFFDDTVLLESGLRPFVIIYDNKGNPVRSSGFLHQKIPRLPNGVLAHATEGYNHLVTWQPEANVRMALVIEKISNPDMTFVAVGRSLKAIEEREAALVSVIFVGWLTCVALILLRAAFGFYYPPTKLATAA